MAERDINDILRTIKEVKDNEAELKRNQEAENKKIKQRELEKLQQQNIRNLYKAKELLQTCFTIEEEIKEVTKDFKPIVSLMTVPTHNFKRIPKQIIKSFCIFFIPYSLINGFYRTVTDANPTFQSLGGVASDVLVISIICAVLMQIGRSTDVSYALNRNKEIEIDNIKIMEDNIKSLENNKYNLTMQEIDKLKEMNSKNYDIVYNKLLPESFVKLILAEKIQNKIDALNYIREYEIRFGSDFSQWNLCANRVLRENEERKERMKQAEREWEEGRRLEREQERKIQEAEEREKKEFKMKQEQLKLEKQRNEMIKKQTEDLRVMKENEKYEIRRKGGTWIE